MNNNVFLPEYHKRKEEVLYFLNIIKEFNHFELNSDDKNSLINFNFNNFDYYDFSKIIRSNFILILYNLIEASISLFIECIYTKFEYENISYAEASKYFQKLYLEYSFLDTFKEDSNYKTYKSKAFEMVDLTLNNCYLDFSIAKISNLSGNIGSNTIQKIWRDHGIKFKSSSRCQHPNNTLSIDNIKDKRNALAHGRESFKECGGKYSVSDLEGYCTEIIKLLDDLMASVKNFIIAEGYKEKKELSVI